MMHERLKAWRESKGWIQEDVAAELMVSIRTYSRYESGEQPPKAAHLERLAELGCDPTWLITGNAALLSTGTANQLQVSDPAFTRNDANHVETIPIYKVSLSAGYGEPVPSWRARTSITLPTEFIQAFIRRNPANLHVVFAAGDSMEPTIRDLDMLIVDHTDTSLVTGQIYALEIGEQLFVKRIRMNIAGEVLVVSDNKEYPPEPFPSDPSLPVRIIGRVVWHGHALT